MAFILSLFGAAVFSIFTTVLASSEWCYNSDDCGPEEWPNIHPLFCSGNEQSPINIEVVETKWNSSLTNFCFSGYSDPRKLHLMKNTGHSVQVDFADGVTISGGGLNETFKALQFHLHWGNGSSVYGSEHTLNGCGFPMEMHILHIGEKFANVSEAIKQNGIAVLGFFIDVATTVDNNQAWEDFVNILPNISSPDEKWQNAFPFSISDLLQSVQKTKYFRYRGSLTTPTCDEGVTWTVFEKPILVTHKIVDKFATEVFINKSTNVRLVNTYRHVQKLNKRTVFTSTSAFARFKAEGQTMALVAICLIWLTL
ncbi:carbonic anhydrase 4-like [Protopterus annectens]|uniref:carbonic anhydrase 4-like n=1 Tax=Protopterus annectens TaxID=7888 RepID=UPI001CFA5B94|nr:carbonic anhydrase 4-like [Protopterus annectens]XP_043942546.1 carbonic anhydrase 4-like [Protopterus annectens]XP_043942547.1 carbonic anhydrase 4-like [Protopterus annectens]